jgi:predicted HTH domain antitoxin
MEGLGSDAEIPRRVLEALILQRYMTEEISLGRLAELLGLNRWEAEAFLDRHNARLPYTMEMLEEDRRNLAEVFGRR